MMMELANISDIESLKSVWREKRKPVGVLTHGFVPRFF